MYINLYEILGVKKGEKFRINNKNYIYQIINNEIYFKGENINWTKSCIQLNDIKEIKKITIEPSNRICDFFKMLKPKWKYVAVDKDGRIYLYTDKPTKNELGGIWDINNDNIENKDTENIDYCLINHLINDKFEFLSWEDEEPFDITLYK